MASPPSAAPAARERIDRAVLVIGAGMAGLACARRLAAEGAHVLVVDKARGAGGRASTRRGDGTSFDHGAQYFTARDAGFAAATAGWVATGVVARWDARIIRLEAGRLAYLAGRMPRREKLKLERMPCSTKAATCASPGRPKARGSRKVPTTR